MSKDTLEGWCTPVESLGIDCNGIADHTFVYCPAKDASFKCWGTANRDDPDASSVCSHSKNAAYCRARKYRVSLGALPDTAGVGIYGVNGVCHQSANLFLFSADCLLPLNDSRPRGVVATHALFGPYGADLPGQLETAPTHFAGWLVAIYGQAEVQCWFRSESSAQPGSNNELIQTIKRLHLEQSGILQSAGASKTIQRNLVPQEMEVLLAHYLPSIDGSVISTVHGEIMAKKDEILVNHGFVVSGKAKEFPRGKQVDDFAKALNALALEFQRQLKEKIGLDSYIKFNGDKEYYKPINPDIARSVFDSMSTE